MRSVWCVLFLFFFFKQKTAYEMRISDWSSDVCSSDLIFGAPVIGDARRHRAFLIHADKIVAVLRDPLECLGLYRAILIGEAATRRPTRGFVGQIDRLDPVILHIGVVRLHPEAVEGRSEEHTSELTSLMRISSAVF